MVVVVPGEECLAERTCVFDRIEASRKVGLILQCFEMRFRVRIIFRVLSVIALSAPTFIRETSPGRFSLSFFLPSDWRHSLAPRCRRAVVRPCLHELRPSLE